MIEAVGDLWTFSTPDARVITTNGDVTDAGKCVMGRGVAEQARDRYPGIDKQLGHLIDVWGNRPFRLHYDRSARVWIATFPVKRHWRERADPDLIRQSALKLVEIADKFHWHEVVMPRPGCGNGRLRWSDVQPILEPILDDRFVVLDYGV
jgi:hypothetical protein